MHGQTNPAFVSINQELTSISGHNVEMLNYCASSGLVNVVSTRILSSS